MNDRMTAQQLKNSILQIAVQGKLVEQDPNDEPASVLLERIREEKEKLIKEGKIKRNKKESIIFKGSDNLHYEKIGNEVKCIEDELPFEIPDSWCWCRLDNLVIKDIKRGKSPKYANESEVQVFAQKCNVKTGGINMELAKYLDISTINKYPETEFIVDKDIIINSTGNGTLGRVGLFCEIDRINSYQIVPDSHVTVVRTSQSLNSIYIYNFLKHFQKKYEECGEGSTNQTELKPLVIANTFVAIPPRNEQNRIIDKLSSCYSELNKYNKVELELYSLNSTYKEQLKKSILQYAIEGKLVVQDSNDESVDILLDKIREEKNKLIAEGKIKKDKNESFIFKRDNSYYENINGKEHCIDDEIAFEIPNSWCWIRFKNLVHYSMGKTPPRKEEKYWINATNHWISISDMVSNGVICKTKELVNDYSAEHIFKNSISKKGTLIMSFKLTVGKVSILGIDSYHNEAIISIYPFVNDSLITRDYLFNTLPLLSQLGSTKKAIKGNTLNSSSLDNLLIPISSLNVQNKINKVIKQINDIL